MSPTMTPPPFLTGHDGLDKLFGISEDTPGIPPGSLVVLNNYSPSQCWRPLLAEATILEGGIDTCWENTRNIRDQGVFVWYIDGLDSWGLDGQYGALVGICGRLPSFLQATQSTVVIVKSAKQNSNLLRYTSTHLVSQKDYIVRVNKTRFGSNPGQTLHLITGEFDVEFPVPAPE